MLTRIDHVGIACRDLETKIAFYESVMGLTVVSREVNEDQGVREAMLQVADGPAGGSYVQLLEPLARTPRSGGSWNGAARGSITSATAWRISQPRWRRSAPAGVRLIDSGPGTAPWARRSRSFIRPISAGC